MQNNFIKKVLLKNFSKLNFWLNENYFLIGCDFLKRGLIKGKLGEKFMRTSKVKITSFVVIAILMLVLGVSLFVPPIFNMALSNAGVVQTAGEIK